MGLTVLVIAAAIYKLFFSKVLFYAQPESCLQHSFKMLKCFVRFFKKYIMHHISTALRTLKVFIST